MARNACVKCGNAWGSDDCKEACDAIDDVRNSFKQRSLVQAAFPREMAPYIDAAKKEIEVKLGRPIDMKNPSSIPRHLYSAIMSKATKDWLNSRS